MITHFLISVKGFTIPDIEYFRVFDVAVCAVGYTSQADSRLFDNVLWVSAPTISIFAQRVVCREILRINGVQ